ncbi:LlaJI family restriction endonuclease [Clostridium botulinum]|uniref:LlaJI family restriction endonuclease n=1 Tax=Clostridium botulinum TaxID=1491 RepID=UPI0013755945|nr:LlaJI family restriction endonuclease [Clostridium botulinum]MCC5417514.1 LlaJI family restriction endonuclease [Clostridium botulinum]NCI18857.1 LlaJI family restriction endonuclease [Clostridium botulinum]NCI34556.1 LlaJI family restriction endonuclease [Clostridium botulinum]NCI71396.1 LlaJI family restriction endonuclease [Clostridium botulinum]NDI37485.1 LlaJI family restriction endonuclease [Clostridium botulinum]
MNIESELLERCHVNKNDDGDRFVGVKADESNVVVYFPIGYKLPDNDDEIRQDILHLISVLAELNDDRDKLPAMNKFQAPQSVDFPINAYMEIILYYMEQNGYYTEKESRYKTGDRGRTDWSKTVKQQRGYIQPNGSLVYINRIVQISASNANQLITQIHKYCVHESFSKLGWLFTSIMPDECEIEKDEKMFLSILHDKLANTNNDKDKRLFSSMIAMLEYLDEKPNQKQFYFGTDRFEYVWEKLIDRVFGIKQKYEYFPHANWNLKYGKNKTKKALQPDTIMLCSGKIFVLDAKYYRYGLTGNPDHLPSSSSINKQITYGEFIASQDKFKVKYGAKVPVYNAFIMPYNPTENIFSINGKFENIGSASGDWKTSGADYEHVQGILVDIRYLMHHYVGNSAKQIIKMAEVIELGFIISDGNLPE